MTAAVVLSAGYCGPAGRDMESLWSAMVESRAPSTHAVELGHGGGSIAVQRAAEVAAETVLEPHVVRRLDRPHLLAWSAVQEALARIDVDSCEPTRVALVVGTGYGVGAFPDEQRLRLNDRGVAAVSPMSIPLSMPNTVAAHLALQFRITGHVSTICTGCSSGAVAIGEGLELIRSGRADVVVAGGVDSLVHEAPLAGFERLGAVSRSGVCRPFDTARDGFVMSEGAAFLVLGRSASALDGSSTVLGSICGFATNVEAFHVVAPDPSGRPAAACMAAALADAGVAPNEVVAVNAHGTGTAANDSAEAAALTQVFESDPPMVTAPKGATGHMIGASGAVEVLLSLMMARHRVVPAIVGTDDPDEALGLPLVVSAPEAVAGGFVLSNSFAFGGHNASVVVGE